MTEDKQPLAALGVGCCEIPLTWRQHEFHQGACTNRHICLKKPTTSRAHVPARAFEFFLSIGARLHAPTQSLHLSPLGSGRSKVFAASPSSPPGAFDSVSFVRKGAGPRVLCANNEKEWDHVSRVLKIQHVLRQLAPSESIVNALSERITDIVPSQPEVSKRGIDRERICESLCAGFRHTVVAQL
jgi:hypothetical protein